jgi:hypothetical protein
MENLSRLLLFSLLPITFAALSAQNREISARDDKFYIALIGHSWAAGAAVTSKDMYDNNSACLQNQAAWEAQITGNNSRTDSAIDFDCSSAQPVAAAKRQQQK